MNGGKKHKSEPKRLRFAFETTSTDQKAGGSNPSRRTKMNDPTQFEQVDETCGLSRVILCLKSLDVTAFLRIDAPWKI